MEGYYGKPIGISKPKLNEINVPLILDLIEGFYLLSKSKIKIYRDKKSVTEKEMLEICRKEHHNFDKKYTVYRNFRDKGYIVNPGIKFGCDFAISFTLFSSMRESARFCACTSSIFSENSRMGRSAWPLIK